MSTKVKKRTTFAIKNVPTTRSVDKRIATLIVRSQVYKGYWADIVLDKMYMHDRDDDLVLRIEYHVENVDLIKDEDYSLLEEQEEELPYEIDMAIREGTLDPKDIPRDVECPFYEYFVEIDKDCNMVISGDEGISVLPYVELLLDEDFISQITTFS